MQVYRMVVAIAVIFGVIVFAHFMSDEATPIDSASAREGWKSAQVKTEKKIDRKKVLAAIKKSNSQNDNESESLTTRSQGEILREAGRELTLEEALKRFRSARNFWAADATLTYQARMERLNKLANALFGDETEIPEETDDDIAEQERLREVYANFNHDLSTINADAGMGLEDRRSRIEELVRKTMEATGS